MYSDRMPHNSAPVKSLSHKAPVPEQETIAADPIYRMDSSCNVLIINSLMVPILKISKIYSVKNIIVFLLKAKNKTGVSKNKLNKTLLDTSFAAPAEAITHPPPPSLSRTGGTT